MWKQSYNACRNTVLYSIDIGSVSVFSVQFDDTSDETEVSATASVWHTNCRPGMYLLLILCASLVYIRAVERGCKNLGFFYKKTKKPKKSKF